MSKYKIVRRIGKGGNGTVYKVMDENGNLYAKKILKGTKSKKAYQRFKDEIEILYGLNNKKGIVEIIESYLPENPSEQKKAYYIMPLGVSLKDYLQDVDDENIVKFVLELCDTLEFLHSKDITHRDIKPENILVINDKPVFSDFGLANFPKKKKISDLNESIGPKWTIAPEMKRISSVVEFKKADVYSFAKSVWMILTRQWKSFDGQYIVDSNISLNKFVKVVINTSRVAGVWRYESIVLLERLLVDATDNDPKNRPSAQLFNKRFKYWYDTNLDFSRRNPYEWEDALLKIFPVSIPESAIWVKIEDIYSVLKIVCERYDNLNHTFYPRIGGMDFDTVELDDKNEYLIINEYEIFKPKALIFESMNNLDWSFFRIEIEETEPLFIKNVHEDYERLFIDSEGNYLSEISNECTELTRFLKGSFLLVKKTSYINQLSGQLHPYNDLHNERSNSEYKELISKIIEHMQRKIEEAV